MPVARARRTLPAPPEAVWAVVGDPRRLPRWWPRTMRVEGVSGRGFTAVMRSSRGRAIRADQRIVALERPRRCAWALEVDGTPFESVLAASETEVVLAPADGGTEVRLELRQRLRGASRLAGPLAWRSARRQLRAALDGLEDAVRG